MRLDEFKNQLISNVISDSSPVFIDISSDSEYKSLLKLAENNRIKYYEPIKHQIKEYQEIYSMLHSEDVSGMKGLTDNNNAVFVFFNWGEKSIFKILPANLHYELVTWRNKEKITIEEQEIIAGKTIGIIGASVGSFATKVLSKSGFRNLKLAEIKNMKPSNATRMYEDSIRNYGKHKLLPLVRGLYEFNPFLNIEVYNNGLTQTNIDDVLFMNGKPLDIIVDAADDGVTKVLIRDFCKKHKRPLVHGFDEKGIFVIQRYDRPELNTYNEPNFTTTELELLKNSNPDKYMMKLLEFIPGGYDNLSQRQKDTICAIQNRTRGGFSQLGWEAALFSSYITKSVIDIALNKNIAGKQLIDFDELITVDLDQG